MDSAHEFLEGQLGGKPPHARASRARRRLRLGATIFLAWVFLLCPNASADVRLFHSPTDGGDELKTPAAVAPGQTSTLFLYIVSDGLASSDPAEVCDQGDGQEVCAVELGLSASGTASFVAFTPEASADIVFHLTPTEFRLNEIKVVDPTIGTRRIGALVVSAAAASCSGVCQASLESGTAVLAGLDPVPLRAASETLVVVPEPGSSTALGLGCFMLAALGSCTRRSSANARRRGLAHRQRNRITSALLFAGTCGVLALLGGTSPVSAQESGDVIFSHVGATDPLLDPEWTALDGGNSSVVLRGPVVGDTIGGQTFDSWAIYDDVSASGASYRYQASPSAEEADNAQEVGWTVRAVLRVIAPFPDAEDLSIIVEYNDGERRFAMVFNADADGDPRVVPFGGTGSYTSEGVGDIYQQYEMVLDPDTQLATIYVDGVARITDYAGILAGAVEKRLNWGSGHSIGTGRAHFHRVEWSVNRDSDRDGIRDSVDNCRHLQNNPNIDTGGVGFGSPPDGTGDACQCGDVSDDGYVTSADVDLYRAHLVDPAGNPFGTTALSRCDLTNGEGCDLASVVLMERALLQLGPGVGAACEAITGYGAACADGICNLEVESCRADAPGCQADCGACGLGDTCTTDEDCASGLCDGMGACVAPPPNPTVPQCGDGICNGVENCAAYDENGCTDDCRTVPDQSSLDYSSGACGVGEQCNNNYDCGEGTCQQKRYCRAGSPNEGSPCFEATEVADCGAEDACRAPCGTEEGAAFCERSCENDRSQACTKDEDCGLRPYRGQWFVDHYSCMPASVCTFDELNEECQFHSDCGSGYCNTPFPGYSYCRPKRADGAPCAFNVTCQSDICNFGFCVGTALPNGSACTTDAACISGECEGAVCSLPSCTTDGTCGNGVGCSADSHCASDNCVGLVCAPAPLPCSGSSRAEGCECTASSQCASNNCVGYQGTNYCVRSGCTSPGVTCSSNGQCCDFPGFNLSCKTHGSWPFFQDRCAL